MKTLLSFSLALLVAVFLVATAANAESPTELAERLTALRGEVETLSEELELKRAERREVQTGLARRRAELESELSREALRQKRLRSALDEERTRVEAAEKEEAALGPAVRRTAARVRDAIAKGLPFRTQDRLKAVDDVTEALDAGTIAPSAAAQRIWSVLQDEERLTRESGLYRQAISIGDEGEVLADIARVGMVLLYFKSPDGRVGQAVPSGDGWRFVALDDKADKKRVLALFDGFKKQLRTGAYELPLGGLR